MFKSIIYKEWIKIKWFAIISFIVSIGTVAYIWLDLNQGFEFIKAQDYWFNVIYRNTVYFSILKYLASAIGLSIGLAQYIPEVVDKRIKLTMHLPMNEEKMILKMMSFGGAVVLTILTVMFLFFIGISSIYFPTEIITAASLSILPWFLSGMAIYFIIGLVALEPIRRYQFAYSIIGLGLVSFFHKKALLGGYSHIAPKLVIITLVLSVSLLFSVYRFRKGEM